MKKEKKNLSKILAVTMPIAEPMYGVPNPTPVDKIKATWSYILIPIIILIGLVTYLFKGKPNKVKKIFAYILIVIAIVAIVYMLVELIKFNAIRTRLGQY